MPVVLHVFLCDTYPFTGAFEDDGGAGERGGILRLLFFQHGERGLLAAFQSADNLCNARLLAIDVPTLVVADDTAMSTLADVDLVNGRAGSDHLPFGDKLFDHHRTAE